MIQITLWHASDRLFTAPDYAEQVSMRSRRDTHANSLLGLWASYRKPYTGQYGRHLYRVTFAPSARYRDLSISELARLNREFDEPSDYTRLRQDWIDSGFCYARLVEEDGRVEQAIILDYACIQEFKHEGFT